MSKGKTGVKQSKDRMFRQMKAKSNMKTAEKVKEIEKQPVLRGELFSVQNTLNARTDSSLMGTAAVVKLLVKNDICTYDDFKGVQKEMTDILKFIRKTIREAYKLLGPKATKEDESAFIYEKAIAFGIEKELLINIFGVKPSLSRIIKPNQANRVISSK